MTLAGNVHRLTRPHLSTLRGQIATVPPLLTQLTMDHGRHSQKVSSERPIPVPLSAIALWQDMEHEAREHQYARTGDDSGGLWQIVESWERVDDAEWCAYLGQVTLDFIDRILATIDPPRPRRPLRQPCAACGQRWTYDADGQRSEAVTAWVWDEDDRVAKVDTWEVTCTSCGAQWVGKEVARTYWRAVDTDSERV